MKNYLFLILICSFGIQAQSLPAEKSPCNWGSTCIDFQGLSTIFGRGGAILNTVGVTEKKYPGIYYQRGVGANCAAATQRAREKLVFNHPEFICDGDSDGKRDDIYCGASNTGPELLNESCMRSSKGEVVAWLVCDNTSITKSPRPKRPSAVGFILLKNMQRQEVKTRASRNR